MSSKSITSFFKRKAEDEGASPSKKQDTESLSKEEEQKLIDLAKAKGLPVVESMGPSWRKALSFATTTDTFKTLMSFLESEKKSGQKIFPPPEDVFNWTRFCPVDDVKVVIIGQDPYHGAGQAHGLCFSVPMGVAVPPSLQNIYKELATDIPGFAIPKHGCLESWARQGVLLLNAVLTVREKTPNSHAGKGWEKFTDAVITSLNDKHEHVVFILWGSYAQKKGAKINKGRHLVLNGVHPSGLSAHKGFFGCKHFSQANSYLKQHGRVEINWSSVNK